MSDLPYSRAEHTDQFLALCKEAGITPPDAYETPDGLRALVSRDEIVPGDRRWHVSVSRQDRMPTWDEFVQSVHQLRPGVFFAVPVPPERYWMSVHPYALHVWETRDESLVKQMVAEALGPRSAQQ